MVSVVNKYKEPNHIYCGRGSVLGNPFHMVDESKRDEVCEQYNIYFHRKINENNFLFMQELDRIYTIAQTKDINLGCFCSPKRCHCDTIKDYIDEKLQNGDMNILQRT